MSLSIFYLATVAEKLDGKVDVAYTARQAEPVENNDTDSRLLLLYDLPLLIDSSGSIYDTLPDVVGSNGGGKLGRLDAIEPPSPATPPANQKLLKIDKQYEPDDRIINRSTDQTTTADDRPAQSVKYSLIIKPIKVNNANRMVDWQQLSAANSTTLPVDDDFQL